MRVHREADVARIRAHLDRERDLCDQVSGAGADDAAAYDPVGCRIEQQLRHPFVAAHRERAAARGPRKDSLLEADALRPRLRLGESDPGNLGVRVRHGGDGPRIEETLLPRGDFGRDLALVGRLVGQHRLADDVADRGDVGYVGAHLPVHADETAPVHRDASSLGVDARAVRRPTDRNEDPVVGLRFVGRVAALEAHQQALRRRLDGRDPGPEHDLLVTRAHALLERLHQVAIAAGHQPVGQLDHAHLHAERVVDGRHLQADDAPADHQQAARQVQVERGRRIHDARVVGKPGQPHRLGAGRDDAAGKAQLPDAPLAVDFELVRGGEPGGAADHGHLALPGEHREATGETPDDPVLPVAQSAGVDLRLAETDAMRSHGLGVLYHAGRMQQCLGGYAADVQAHAAQRRPALDQRDAEAQIGGAECGRVSARSRAEHREVELVRLRTGLRRPGILRAGLLHRARRLRGRLRPRVGAATTGHRHDRHRVEVRLAAVGLCRAQRGARRGLAGIARARGLPGDLRDDRAGVHLVPGLHQHRSHEARGRGRYVHRRLVAFQRHERRLEFHSLARPDQHLDDGDVAEAAEIRYPDCVLVVRILAG